MKKLTAILALYTCFSLSLCLNAQEQPKPPEPENDAPVVEDLAIPQRGPAAKPEYRHERRTRLRGMTYSDRLEERFHMIMKYLEKNNPSEYERLMKIRNSDREKFAKEIWQHSPEHNETRQKIAELDKQCWDLAEQYKLTGTDSDKDKIKAKLQSLIDESTQLVIKDTQERLEKLQSQLQEMEKDQDKVKERRLEFFLTNDRPSRPSRPMGPMGPMGRPRLRRSPQGGPLQDMHANPYSIPVPNSNDAPAPAAPEKK
ncbi:MAG: hypothetical protein GX902_10460 [Lentisphaerae bacterium]|nr:hypothetical protein [Lentisphaerota bacterium]